MKAITIRQPWATLMATDNKRIETRGWNTHHRGPLAIHAGKHFPVDARLLCWEIPFRTVLEPLGVIDYGRHYPHIPHDAVQRFEAMPLAVILAVGVLVDVQPSRTLATFFEARRRRKVRTISGVAPMPYEQDFGDYGPRRWGFIFAPLHALTHPVPSRGALGLWDIPDPTMDLLTQRERSA